MPNSDEKPSASSSYQPRPKTTQTIKYSSSRTSSIQNSCMAKHHGGSCVAQKT